MKSSFTIPAAFKANPNYLAILVLVRLPVTNRSMVRRMNDSQIVRKPLLSGELAEKVQSALFRDTGDKVIRLRR
jgi:hypothetical protein